MSHHTNRIVLAIALIGVSVHEVRADAPKGRTFKAGDVLTVTVKEAASTNADRQRNGQYAGQLAQFLRINAQGNLDNAAQNSPENDSELQSRLQTAGRVESRPTSYQVTAIIAEILPSGELVIDAHKCSVDNTEFWRYSLSGKVDPKHVAADNSVLSEHISDLCIAKCQHHSPTQHQLPKWVSLF